MLRRAIAVVLVATSALAVVPTGFDGIAAALNPNLLTLEGETNDYIIGAQSLSYSTFTVTGTNKGVQIDYSDPAPFSGVWWTIELYPPSAEQLAPGFYEDATRYPFNAADVPGLSVSGSGRGCNTLTGRFVIDEITFNADATSTVKSLVAHWEQHCSGGTPASFGTVSWNGSTPLSSPTAGAPGAFPATTIDTVAAAKPITITAGDTALTVTSVQLSGADPGQFQIVADPCTGSTVPAAGSCVVQVAFAPTQMGTTFATLDIVDSLHPTGNPVPLRGKGAPSVATYWAEGEFGDWVIGATHMTIPVVDVSISPDRTTLTVAASAPSYQSVSFGSPDGQLLAVGTYDNAQRNFSPRTSPYFDMSGNGRGCNAYLTRFVVDQLDVRANGVVNRFVAHWEAHCENGEAASFGGVNYNGTVPFVERTIDPQVRDFGSVAVGFATSQAITITNAGPSPDHVVSATLSGTGASAYAVTADNCSGATLAAGSSCSVSVRFLPSTAGGHTARLTVVDDIAQVTGAGTGQDIILTGTATSVPMAFLEGEADDSMVGGPHVDLTNLSVAGGAKGITITGNEGSNLWTITLAPRTGTTFAAAPATFLTKRTGSQDATHAGLEVKWNDVRCSSATGRLVIDDLTFNPNGGIKTLSARWEYHCSGETAASFGGIRLRSTAPFVIPDLTDIAVWDQIVNGSVAPVQHVTLTNHGASNMTVGPVTLSGTDASQFRVITDGCSNTVVVPGTSCTVDMAFAPTSANIGEKVARLTVPHTAALLGKGGTGHDVMLRGSSTVAASSNFGELTPVNPARLADTTAGFGAPKAPIGAGGVLTVQVAGRGGVPATGVGSVIVNVTTRRSTSAASFVTTFPTGSARPGMWTLVPVPGLTISNLTTVRLGTGGRISVYNKAGTTDVTIDVVGWYSNTTGPNGARYHSLRPTRIVNTAQGVGAPRAAIPAGGTLKVDVRKKGGIPSTGATVVALNVTAVTPTATGALTVFPGDRTRPAIPNVSFSRGSTVSNTVIVRLPATGIVQFFNSAGSANLTVDVLGYWTATATGNAGRFVPVSQTRAFDTAKLGGPQPAGSTFAYQIGGRTGVAHDAAAAVLNISAVKPSTSGYLKVYADDLCNAPATSTLSFVAGRSVANGAYSTLSLPQPCAILRSAVDVYNSAGNTNVTVDVIGYFTP